MSKISYPCLPFILEHMEANKRIHVTARCPSLRKIEKQVPLNIRYLKIKDTEIKINDISYELCKQEESLTVVRGQLVEQEDAKTNEIGFERDGKHWCTRTLPERMTFDVAAQKLMKGLLGGRPKVVVNEFKVSTKTEQLPYPDLKVHTKNFETYQGFDSHFSMIHVSSLPLKVSEVGVTVDTTLNNPVLKAAETLKIPYMAHQIDENFMRLPNKYMHFKEGYLSEMNVKTILRNWIENRQAIGTMWKMIFHDVLLPVLAEIKKEFDGKMMHVPDKRFYRRWGCVLIPLDSRSVITVYAVREHSKVYLKMNVIAAFE